MPKFSKSRWEKILVLESFLCKHHPKTFVPFRGQDDSVYPLKIGIAKDLLARYQDIDEPVLASFMKHYVTMPRYLKIVSREGMPRVDLDGNVASVISAHEARQAANFLGSRLSRRAPQQTAIAARDNDACELTGKVKFLSAFEADQAMVRTHQRARPGDVVSSHSYKCRCGFYHWGRKI